MSLRFVCRQYRFITVGLNQFNRRMSIVETRLMCRRDSSRTSYWGLCSVSFLFGNFALLFFVSFLWLLMYLNIWNGFEYPQEVACDPTYVWLLDQELFADIWMNIFCYEGGCLFLFPVTLQQRFFFRLLKVTQHLSFQSMPFMWFYRTPRVFPLPLCWAGSSGINCLYFL